MSQYQIDLNWYGKKTADYLLKEYRLYKYEQVKSRVKQFNDRYIRGK